jgi:UDPglucose 6-dehydrogenase
MGLLSTISLKKKVINVIGCGKLGAPLVAVLAECGFQVNAIDLNKELIVNLKNGIVNWNEPGLTDLLKTNKSKINFSSEFLPTHAVADLTYVIVPTPSMPDGAFSNDYVLSAISNLAAQLKLKASREHLIIIVSTVMPGSTAGPIQNELDLVMGGKDHKVSLCYSPEFIALGSVIHNMRYPDLVLVGEDSENSGDLLITVSLKIARNKPPVFRLTTREAEIAKISINSFVTTKISFSNQISEICEATEGASASRVLSAIGSDSRIGKSYLSAATAFGGPCFPRDNRAFSSYAKSLNTSHQVASATDLVNIAQSERLLRYVQRIVPPQSKLIIVGVSYKAGTNVCEESPSLSFAELAKSVGYKICLVDENADLIDTSQKIHDFDNFDFSSLKNSASLLFVPSKGYLDLPRKFSFENNALIDLWGLWAGSEISQHNSYFRYGDYVAASKK